MIESWHALIDKLGGTGAVAAGLGLSASIVSGWRKRGIPSSRWLAVCRFAEAAGVEGITAETLARLDAARSMTVAEAVEART